MGLFSKFKARLNSNTKKTKPNEVVCTKFIQFTESTTSDKEINYAFDVTKLNSQQSKPPVILNKEQRKKARPQSVHLPSRKENMPEVHATSLKPSVSFNNKLDIITKPKSEDKKKGIIENNVSEQVKKPNQSDENIKQLKTEIKPNLEIPPLVMNNKNVNEDSVTSLSNDMEDKVDEMNNFSFVTKNVKFKKVSTVSSIDSDDAIHLGNQTNVKFIDTGDSSEEEQQLFPVNIVAKNEKSNVPDVYYSTNDEDEDDNETEDDEWQQEGFSSYASNIFFSGIHDETEDDDNEMSQC